MKIYKSVNPFPPGKGLNIYFTKIECTLHCTALGFNLTRTRAVLVRGA